MKKFLKMYLSIQCNVVDWQPVVQIFISPVILKDWCLSLQLLQENLVEAIVFMVDGAQKVEFVVEDKSRFHVKDHGALHISLGVHELDVVRHFFLHYYRDGAAEVDHIDFETVEGGYITFSVEEFLEPVSDDEVKRRLGIE